tara:strand:- start:626 stop:802 length:177 start_codon:yes stop_codon:yes gene_type:complete
MRTVAVNVLYVMHSLEMATTSALTAIKLVKSILEDRGFLTGVGLNTNAFSLFYPHGII